jgi:hypothetical protein
MDLREYYPSGKYSDITIAIDGKMFHVHKIILESASGIFF